jgi:lipopolysaccharide transport system permease protein
LEIPRPFSFLCVGWSHRRLIVRLASRKIESRYRGSMLGSLWTLLQPLLMLAVYTFVFGTVFRSRWQLDDGAETPFALVLFAGMVFYAIFAECTNEAPTLMIANQTYIKQVPFPIEVLPWVSIVAALFGFAVNLALLAVFQIASTGPPPWTAPLATPLLLVPLLLFTLGVSWMLSAAGVFLRDLSQIAGVVTTTLLFLSPIFYPADRIPEPFRRFYDVNPFVPLIEGFRAALFEGRFPDPRSLLVLTALGWAAAWLGYLGFMSTKKGFADVL